MILGAIYTSFIAPVEIAFPQINDQFHDNPFIHSLDIIVDILFLIDIIVNFLTEYTDTSSGDQIRNPVKIAKRYILSVFMFDLASCIPFISSLFFG